MTSPLPPDLSIDWPLVQRYLTGECSVEEKSQMEDWAASSSENATLLASLRQVTAVSYATRPRPELGTSWQHLAHRLKVADVAKPAVRSRYRSMLLSWGAAAAALMLVVGLGLHAFSRWSIYQSVRDFSTPAGGRATVTLHDGTQVLLGPASHLRLAGGLTRGPRAVALDGEALFTVVHNTRHPFVVHTAYGDLQDIGTTFAVRAYTDDHTAHVAVTEGSVAIHGQALVARDVAAIDGLGHVAVFHGVDMRPFTAWAQNHLAFSDTPLRDVARELARRYDLTIVVTDSVLASKHLTADFGDQPLTSILSDIVALAGAEYQQAGRTVTIRPLNAHSIRVTPNAPSRQSFTVASPTPTQHE